MPITYLIIGFTCIISYLAFNNQDYFYNLKHWPYRELRNKEYFRWISSGFLHADPTHLIFNMVTLYFFGSQVESWFSMKFPGIGGFVYLLFYLVSIGAASSATYQKYKNNSSFASIGASGATAAVLFASICLNPTNGIYMFFIPIAIPGFIFGFLYLWYSDYAAKKGNDNIDHTAHFFGAVFGFFIPILIQPNLIIRFINGVSDWFRSL